ncbi:hypothetical protein CLOP_g24377 [Closterium sp. NIES-67]|nr:hypothetical protein CLOP_g24377 [Closterium sp. NIES-67]
MNPGGYSGGFGPPPGLPDIPGGVAPWAFSGPPTQPGSAPSQRVPGNLVPLPKVLSVPVLDPPYRFCIPQKRIASTGDTQAFLEGESGRWFLGFIVGLSESIQGKKVSDPCHVSPTCQKIVDFLETLISWVDEIPPSETLLRYGNPAYRTWQDRLQERGPSLVADSIFPENLKAAVGETFPYLADSFGNWTRIDFGTGHETNFAAWLMCLVRLGLLVPDDYQALVSHVFVKYLELMRKLQLTYWLEPAGSHGVWGLDDYHFLPFIFGSSQLIGHKYLRPKSILNPDILENFAEEYLYFSSVVFVKKVKKGPLAEHSPMINDISGVPNWNKVNSGMLKMYRAEVLEKVPIMQHFLFGSLIPWPGKAGEKRGMGGGGEAARGVGRQATGAGAGVTGAGVTGAGVPGAAVTGAAVTGAAVTGAAGMEAVATGAAVTGAGVTGADVTSRV